MLIADGGCLSRRLRYLKSHTAPASALAATSAPAVGPTPRPANQPNDKDEEMKEVSENTAAEDLQFLKYAVIRDTDKNVILAKLNSTRAHRLAIVRDRGGSNSDIRENFPFFFSNPELVSDSFNKKYVKAFNYFLFIDIGRL